MNQYEHSLIAMKRLLDAVGESHWARKVDLDIAKWRANRDTSHHLSAYGGMGSFNDIWICRANHHTLTDSQEPWANTLFEWLKSLCHFLAQHPDDSFDLNMLTSNIGRRDSTLAALVGGGKAPASIRGYATEDRKLQGWRCLGCGYGEASNRDIEYLVAEDVVPHMVFQSCEHSTLEKLVDQTLAGNILDLEAMRQSLAAAISSSGIALIDRDGWMRPCPSCGEDDTAVYRWRLVVNGGLHFEVADDNLPMRTEWPNK